MRRVQCARVLKKNLLNGIGNIGIVRTIGAEELSKHDFWSDGLGTLGI